MRASTYIYTTTEEIDTLIATVAEISGVIDALPELPIVKVDDESFVAATHPVVEERCLSVTVNGRHALTATCSR